MLFSRRKAEIEVLGSTRPSAGASGGVADRQTDSTDRFREARSSDIPLVRYLVSKIRSACVVEGESVVWDDERVMCNM